MNNFKNLLGILVLPLVIPVLITGLVALQIKVFGMLVGGKA